MLTDGLLAVEIACAQANVANWSQARQMVPKFEIHQLFINPA
jgi:hypothetical protein